MNKKIILGRIGRPHGIKGWIRIISYTTPEDNITQYQNLYLLKDNQWTEFHNIEYKQINSKIYLKIPHCDTPEMASQYTHQQIGVNRSALPDVTNHDEYYWEDLIGLTVFTPSGDTMGTVTGFMETGSNDVFIVKGEQRHLIPFTESAILTIDLENQKIIADWDL